MKKNVYLPGLNTLRFIAASLVIIGHGHDHLEDLKINWFNDAPIFMKAGEAVKFFFRIVRLPAYPTCIY